MDINILKYIIDNNYSSLLDYTKGKDTKLDKFYNFYAKYQLDHSDNEIFNYLSSEEFGKKEASIIYDLLDNSHDNKLKEAKIAFLEKYKDLINLEKPFSDLTVSDMSKKIEFPSKNDSKYKFNIFIGFILLGLSFISLIISSIIITKLDEEVFYFTSILLLILPSCLIALGVNVLFFKKNNLLLMAVETFLLLYILSFILLGHYLEAQTFFSKVQNHFYEVIKSLYSFIEYYTFKALEGA